MMKYRSLDELQSYSTSSYIQELYWHNLSLSRLPDCTGFKTSETFPIMYSCIAFDLEVSLFADLIVSDFSFLTCCVDHQFLLLLARTHHF